MGMVKKALVEHEITMEDFEAGLEWMTRYGVKTFKDHTGEWVETRCAREVDLFTGEETPIAHLTEEIA
mgnify:CR=1 FL=1